MRLPGGTEADTCREYVLPKLYTAGWKERLREQHYFTDGRVVVIGRRTKPREGKKADYLLDIHPNCPIAVVEAKRAHKKPGDGLQQAMDYAKILGLKFAYSTNGHGIVEHDYTTGGQRDLDAFPTPDDLWARLRKAEGLTEDRDAEDVLFPFNRELRNPDGSVKVLRYYQSIAVQRAVQAVIQGKRRILLTMATGTGKTFVAAQIVWKLWKTRRKPRILYLADRNILVDQPRTREFAMFEEAVWPIKGVAQKGREIYFATYQAIAGDKRRPGLYKEYPRDYFDLIIVDECHRGSAQDESRWREILEYFEPATQIGMTATPRSEVNRDTYAYFGDPLYTYTLARGIDDGFLAPYKVIRVVPSPDLMGVRVDQGQLDRFRREIPPGLYETKDFERIVSILARTELVARHLTEYLKKTNRMDKTIVFCADQEHAEMMRAALHNANDDLTGRYPHYVARVVSDEDKVGRDHFDVFADPEKDVPVILTTSQMLTTGVDVPTCRNIVFFKVVGSMVEFKQIIGRGTRIYEDKDKLFFTILDYVGATQKFADPDFDGEPGGGREETLNPAGKVVRVVDDEPEEVLKESSSTFDQSVPPGVEAAPGKYYMDGGQFFIVAVVERDLDAGGRLRTMRYTDYVAKEVRELYPSASELRSKWTDAEQRAAILAALKDRNVTLEQLAESAHQPDADPFDLLVHVAWNGPLRSRRERAEQARRAKPDFWTRFTPQAREILDELLEQYVTHGVNELTDMHVLEVPPISGHGRPSEIAHLFGGKDNLHKAFADLQALLYAA